MFSKNIITIVDMCTLFSLLLFYVKAGSETLKNSLFRFIYWKKKEEEKLRNYETSRTAVGWNGRFYNRRGNREYV